MKRLGTDGLLWRLSNHRHCAAWGNQEPPRIYAEECQQHELCPAVVVEIARQALLILHIECVLRVSAEFAVIGLVQEDEIIFSRGRSCRLSCVLGPCDYTICRHTFGGVSTLCGLNNLHDTNPI